MAKILIIDDEPPIRCLLRLWLEDAGYEVLEADSGREGLRLFDLHQVDLVITDMAMPGMNGLEVIGAIRKHLKGQHCPVITACGSRDDIDLRAVDAADAATETLYKPFGSQRLLESVEKALAHCVQRG